MCVDQNILQEFGTRKSDQMMPVRHGTGKIMQKPAIRTVPREYFLPMLEIQA